MSKILIRWSPEGASVREFEVDLINPDWDVRLRTEEATDWPWDDFRDRLGRESAIAWRALLWALRLRTEPRLALLSVTVDMDEIEIDTPPELPEPKKAKAKKDDGSGEA